jgi:EpsI family protein
MDQQTPKYWLVLVAFIVACAATFWIKLKPVEARFSADLASLPMTIGSWQGETAPVDAEVEKSLEADGLISRIYTGEMGDTVQLLVVYRKYGRRGFVHRPEMCFPAAGYEIVSKSLTTVPYHGRKVQATKIIAQKDGGSVVILYWYASGERTEASFVKQQVWMAMDRLKPYKYGWAFIRVTCPVVYSESDTMDRLQDFLSAASRPLTNTLTRSRSAGT